MWKNLGPKGDKNGCKSKPVSIILWLNELRWQEALISHTFTNRNPMQSKWIDLHVYWKWNKRWWDQIFGWEISFAYSIGCIKNKKEQVANTHPQDCTMEAVLYVCSMENTVLFETVRQCSINLLNDLPMPLLKLWFYLEVPCTVSDLCLIA